jgi:hypothetical protein
MRQQQSRAPCLVQLLLGVARGARQDAQQRLLLREHLAPLDLDLDRLPLARRRHARLLQHCWYEQNPQQFPISNSASLNMML